MRRAGGAGSTAKVGAATPCNSVYPGGVGGIHLLAEAGQKNFKPHQYPDRAARSDPFSGIGKPEPLLGNLSGYWSRRIDEAHRLVVAVDDADFDVISCRGTMTTSDGKSARFF